MMNGIYINKCSIENIFLDIADLSDMHNHMYILTTDSLKPSNAAFLYSL